MGWCFGMTERKHLAYICAPFRGDVEQNIERAKEYARYVYDKGFIPVTPHVMFPFLNDDNPSERESAMQMDMELLSKCEYMYVFGKMTDGMQKEFDFAVENEIKCVVVDTNNVDESLDETYIEWLRTKVALYRRVLPDEVKSDVDKQLVQDAEMFERIAERLERLKNKYY